MQQRFERRCDEKEAKIGAAAEDSDVSQGGPAMATSRAIAARMHALLGEPTHWKVARKA
jgi:hypothetical protein